MLEHDLFSKTERVGWRVGLPGEEMEETRLDVRVGTVVDGRVDVVQTESDTRRYELLEDAGRLFYDQHQQLQ